MEDGKVSSSYARLLMFLACRCEMVQTVFKAAMDRGAWIICDRYVDSTRAYQCEVEHLKSARHLCEIVEDAPTGIVTPALTVLLSTDVEVCMDRLRARGEDPDKQHLIELAFAFSRVSYSDAFPESRRWCTIYDHGNSAPEELAGFIHEAVMEQLQEWERTTSQYPDMDTYRARP